MTKAEVGLLLEVGAMAGLWLAGSRLAAIGFAAWGWGFLIFLMCAVGQMGAFIRAKGKAETAHNSEA
jgi:hypothetical protein